MTTTLTAITIFILFLVVLLISVTIKLYKVTREVDALQEIMVAVTEDIQEVRNVTHGKPKIALPKLN